jgi:hypothetical protein
MAVSVSGCATPLVVLKNKTTGQVVRCGDERSGSEMGGMIGYSLQKDDADKCIRDFEAQGFKPVE